MKLVNTKTEPGEAKRILQKLDRRAGSNMAKVMPAVEPIVADVRRHGDRALRRYSAQFDGLGLREPLEIGREEMERAWMETPKPLQAALKTAELQIRRFAELQMPKDWTRQTSGMMVGQRARAIGSVGCYVPGGRHPLPSTLLMTAIPARVAGVKRVVAVSAKPAVEILAAAWLAEVDCFYRIGGAQAVAALAYGTRTVSRVDKIVGPGNWYVTAAKKLVAFDCAIDMLAGPTEIVVASDGGDGAWIAADLVAQAEHDPDALAIFVTTKRRLAASVAKQTEKLAQANPIARTAIERHGLIFLTGSAEEARNIVNRIAPEHLTVDSVEDVDWVENAGSVFVGRFSPQPMGDYVSGPNHTLPTGGHARVRGGLSVMDFLKLVTVQEYQPKGLARLGPAAIAMARAEGLDAHAAAVEARLKGLKAMEEKRG